MVLGLTGSIAAGKSAVANCFVDCGAILVSADSLAREVVNPGSPVLERLVALFGMDILTPGGSLDRGKLSEKVFADPAARRQLESIVHPAIALLAESRLTELRQSPHDLIVYEAPLLFEAGAESRVDRILVVMVEPTVQMARLLQRDKLTEVQARQRIDAQWPQADKIGRADFVIDNSGSLSQTSTAVADLYRYLVSSSSTMSSNS